MGGAHELLASALGLLGPQQQSPGLLALPPGAAPSPVARRLTCRSLLRGPVGQCADPSPPLLLPCLLGQGAWNQLLSGSSWEEARPHLAVWAQCARRAAQEATLWGSVPPPYLSGRSSMSPGGASACSPQAGHSAAREPKCSCDFEHLLQLQAQLTMSRAPTSGPLHSCSQPWNRKSTPDLLGLHPRFSARVPIQRDPSAPALVLTGPSP